MPRAGFLTRPGLTLPPLSPQQGGVSAGVSWLQAAPAQGPLGDLKAGVLLSSLPLTCRGLSASGSAVCWGTWPPCQDLL